MPAATPTTTSGLDPAAKIKPERETAMQASAAIKERREVTPKEVREEYEREEDAAPQFARTDAYLAVTGRSQAARWGGESFQSQLELLGYMRRGTIPAAELDCPVRGLGLVWRLITATALAVAVATVGVLLTLSALLGGGLTPSPIVALSVLFTGIALLATLLVALRTG
jgi:hypothetical protein